MTRVLIVDDHTLVRQCLRSILERYADIEIVGEASDGNEALLCVSKLRPAVVVMDINMSKMDGITTTYFIKTQYPEIVVIGLSAEWRNHQLHAMHKAGGSQVLLKENAAADLYIAIQQAVAEAKTPEIDTINPALDKASTMPEPV